jgi:hypothetical protein
MTAPSETFLPVTIQSVSSGSREIKIPVRVVAPATLKGTLIEKSTGKVWPGRVHLVSSDNQLRQAGASALHETLSEKSLLQFPLRNRFYKLPFFYSDGSFEIQVPPGTTRVTLERGYEHPLVSKTISLVAGEIHEVTLASERFLDMQQLGWISGDTHIHWAINSWDVNEDIDLLALVQKAEDLRVANNLTLKHHTDNVNFIAPTQFPMGPVPGYAGPLPLPVRYYFSR